MSLITADRHYAMHDDISLYVELRNFRSPLIEPPCKNFEQLHFEIFLQGLLHRKPPISFRFVPQSSRFL